MILTSKMICSLICLITFSLVAKAQSKSSAFVKIVKWEKNERNKDSILYWDCIVSKRNSPSRIISASKDKNGYFNYQIPDVNGLGYMSVDKGYTENSFDLRYIIEPGDSVTMQSRYDFITFLGKGAAKYNCISNINSLYLGLNYDFHLNTKWSNDIVEGIVLNVSKYDSILKDQIFILDFWKPKLSSDVYKLIKVNINGLHKLRVYELFQYALRDSRWKARRNEIIQLFNHVEIKMNSEKVSENLLLISESYSSALVEKAKVEGLIKYKTEYYMLKNKYSGEIRDKLLSFYLNGNIAWINNTDSILNDALSIVGDNPYGNAIRNLANANLEGSKAYNFELPNTEGKIIKLEDFLGKAVFIDFWFTGCTGCVYYYKNVVSKVENKLKNNSDIVFISINIDKSRKLWIDGISSGLYTNNDIINLYTEGKGEHHPVSLNYRVSGCPKPVLIDKKGKVFSISDNELRTGGTDKLIETINRALTIN